MRALSRKILDLEESQTLAFTQRARAMKESGIDIVSLTAGEPDFPTPRHIKEAAIKAIEADFTHYTANQGTPELIDAIIDKFSSDNDLHFSPSQILVSSGAKQSIFNALRAILNPGDEVVVPAPYWVSYPPMVRLADGVPVIVPPADSGFRPDARAIRRAIGPKTRALILNSPCNPTGVVFTRSELEEIAAVVKEAGITVISDEIYEKVVFDGRKHFSIGSLKSISNQVVTVNGVSKAYAMTGWRIGYMGGPEEIIRAAAKVQGQVTNHANAIAQKATVAALRGPQRPIDEMTGEFQRRRDRVVERLGELPRTRIRPPEGAMFLFFTVAPYLGKSVSSGMIRNPADLVVHLLERHRVALVPGDPFGSPDCVRLSFACSMADLEKGLDRVVAGFRELG
ncbi:MAG: pyridoxal phosphate-dependent aminotransferase [Bacteroidota bacterium]